tara:strand:- start:3320 stop:4192 length:873 start_codon:yes stop_codon:yes gene_type:complete
MSNSTEKNLSTLVDDIYSSVSKLNTGEEKIPTELLDSLLEGIKNAMVSWATPRNKSGFALRMSNIGKPSRQLYYENKYADAESTVNASTSIKFLYGHLLEEVLIFLVKLSGHAVTDRQKEVVVSGVKGHMDCKIDGEVVDIKTASNFAFKKFKNGRLAEDDPFGYLSQLTGYEKAEGTENGGFLVINKESGELTLFQPEDLDKPNVESLISKLMKLVFNLGNPPEKCYAPVPAGTKGNMKLPRGCTYCGFKIECNKDANDGDGLRIFKYAKGLEYLTKVKSVPKVEEISS